MQAADAIAGEDRVGLAGRLHNDCYDDDYDDHHDDEPLRALQLSPRPPRRRAAPNLVLDHHDDEPLRVLQLPALAAKYKKKYLPINEKIQKKSGKNTLELCCVAHAYGHGM